MKAILLEALHEVTTESLVTKAHANDMAEELAEALEDMGYRLVKVDE